MKQAIYFEVAYDTTIDCIECDSTADYECKLSQIKTTHPDAKVVFTEYDDGSCEDGWEEEEQ